MQTRPIKSYCKINLFLDVGKKIKKLKLHNIQSLIFQLNIYDEISIKKNRLSKDIIKFEGKFAKNVNKKNNSVNDTLRLLRKKGFIKKGNNYQVVIKKNIPVFSGFGGGSSNAATIIRFFTKNKILQKNDIDYFSKTLGSDLRIFLMSSKIFQKNLISLKNFNKNYKFYFILVYPYLKCSTQEIYSRLSDYKNIKNRNTYRSNSRIDLANNLQLEENSLQKIVVSKFSVINKILFQLYLIKDCYLSRVTGSGSACFGLFLKKKSAELGLTKIKKQFPKLWCVVGKTI